MVIVTPGKAWLHYLMPVVSSGLYVSCISVRVVHVSITVT